MPKNDKKSCPWYLLAHGQLRFWSEKFYPPLVPNNDIINEFERLKIFKVKKVQKILLSQMSWKDPKNNMFFYFFSIKGRGSKRG